MKPLNRHFKENFIVFEMNVFKGNNQNIINSIFLIE